MVEVAGDQEVSVSQRRTSVGLRTRLLALVLVPLLLLGTLIATSVGQRRERAADASLVLARVDRITQLVDLSSGLLLARTPVEVEVRALDLGLDPADALGMLELDALDIEGLDGVVRSLRAMAPDERPFSVERVERLAQRVDAGASQAQLDTFQALQSLLEAEWEDQVAVLRDQIVVLGDRQLARTAEELIAASTAGSATANLLVGLADHWFSSLTDPGRSERARLALGAPMQRFESSLDQMQRSDDPAVVRAARDLAALRAAGAFGDALEAALAGLPPAPFVDGVDVELIVATFTDSFAELQPLLSTLEGRSNELAAEARALADRSSTEADLNLAAMVLLTAVLLAVTVLTVRSIGTPLRRLIAAMRQVGRGDLSGELLPAGGPPELDDASAAFNDVLVNLRLLDGKVQALADADLDDPRVTEELPGALGRELDASVGVLASSIADRADREERLEHQATHDPLTGIHNRAGAHEALRAAVARSRRSGRTLAVAFLDLDGFKAVNDVHGHATGDRVLAEVAARLADEARAGDTCARLGGDEFLVIAENMTGPMDARSMGRRIAATVARPMRLGPDRTVAIGVSVGLALTDDPTEPPEGLLHRADLAAYRAKRAGTGVEVAAAELPEVDGEGRAPQPRRQ